MRRREKENGRTLKIVGPDLRNSQGPESRDVAKISMISEIYSLCLLLIDKQIDNLEAQEGRKKEEIGGRMLKVVGLSS